VLLPVASFWIAMHNTVLRWRTVRDPDASSLLPIPVSVPGDRFRGSRKKAFPDPHGSDAPSVRDPVATALPYRRRNDPAPNEIQDFPRKVRHTVMPLQLPSLPEFPLS